MKQAIVARTDLGMGQGKLAAQVAHASLSAHESADDSAQSEWKSGGQRKVVLKGSGESQLQELADQARREGRLSGFPTRLSVFRGAVTSTPVPWRVIAC